MVKRLIGTLFLITFLIFTSLPDALCTQNTINVNPTYGTDAQTAINSAINSVAAGATSSNRGNVLLASGTYNISAPIILKSNVALKGSGYSTIIFGSSSVCNSEGSPSYIYGSGITNAEIGNMQFKSSAGVTGDGGHGEYRNCIQLQSSSNVRFMMSYSPHIFTMME